MANAYDRAGLNKYERELLSKGKSKAGKAKDYIGKEKRRADYEAEDAARYTPTSNRKKPAATKSDRHIHGLEAAYESLRDMAKESVKAFQAQSDTLSTATAGDDPMELLGLFSKNNRKQNKQTQANFDLRKEEITRRMRMPGMSQTRLVGIV